MFCENCGMKIEGDSKFCPACGAPVQTTKIGNATENLNQPIINQPEPTPTQPDFNGNFATGDVGVIAKTNSKKTGKWVAIILVAVAVIASVIGVIFMFATSKGYEKEVENYLNYFADKSKDAEEFVSVGYFGGEFGAYLNGKDAAEVNALLMESLFEGDGEVSDMYYYYGSSSNKGNWEKALKDSSISRLYDTMDYVFGDWKLSYEIEESEKISKSKIDDLQDILEESAEFYEDFLKDADLSSDDEDTVEDFIDDISDKKIKEAYEVEVDIEIEGDKREVDETYKFKVAKVGRDWVILDGPSYAEIMEDAEK